MHQIPGRSPGLHLAISSMVPNAARSHRVRAQPGPWSLAGVERGAFCATKLLHTEPRNFQAAGVAWRLLHPITDRTTGDLFHGDPAGPAT